LEKAKLLNIDRFKNTLKRFARDFIAKLGGLLWLKRPLVVSFCPWLILTPNNTTHIMIWFITQNLEIKLRKIIP
jgi:hypothetical protein